MTQRLEAVVGQKRPVGRRRGVKRDLLAGVALGRARSASVSPVTMNTEAIRSIWPGRAPRRARRRDRRPHHVAHVPRAVQRVDVEAVGHLAGRARHALADAGERDRDVRMLDRAGIEEVADQREAVEAAFVRRARGVLEGVQDRAEAADVVDDPRGRVVELGREPALDMGAHLGPEPEQQAPAAQALQVPGGLSHGERGARERDRDPVPRLTRAVVSAAANSGRNGSWAVSKLHRPSTPSRS